MSIFRLQDNVGFNLRRFFSIFIIDVSFFSEGHGSKFDQNGACLPYILEYGNNYPTIMKLLTG